jgi:hypothetical protein
VFDFPPRVLASIETRSVSRGQVGARRWIVVAIAVLAAAAAIAPGGFAASQSPASDPVATAVSTIPAAQDVLDAVTQATENIAPVVGAPTAPSVPAPPSAPAPEGEGDPTVVDGQPPQGAGPSDSAESHESKPVDDGVSAAASAERQPRSGGGQGHATGGDGQTKATPSAGQQSAGAGQSSSTSQSAGSSATTIQVAPINIVIPILIGSSGIVNVANVASSWSSAHNSSTTVQISPGGGSPGTRSGLGDRFDVPSAAQTILGELAGWTGIDVDVNLNLNWDWNWTWDGGWNFGGGHDSRASGPASSIGVPAANGSAHSSAPRLENSRNASPPFGKGSRVNRLDASRGPSSSIVQTPEPQPLFPATGLPVPAPSPGGGISPLTLLLGVLAALLVQFGSAAGLLGRRLSLAGAGWRRQAYLAPLQRPG